MTNKPLKIIKNGNFLVTLEGHISEKKGPFSKSKSISESWEFALHLCFLQILKFTRPVDGMAIKQSDYVVFRTLHDRVWAIYVKGSFIANPLYGGFI